VTPSRTIRVGNGNRVVFRWACGETEGDTTSGISTILLQFPDEYPGEDFWYPNNRPEPDLFQTRSPEQQKRRVREVASLFSEYSVCSSSKVGQDAAAAISITQFNPARKVRLYSISVGELSGHVRWHARRSSVSAAGWRDRGHRVISMTMQHVFCRSYPRNPPLKREPIDRSLDGQIFDQSTRRFTA